MITPASIIEDLPGYKIPNSHFRIGSKIHITDFYYAKRYFQNSFFASRMAFNLAKVIVDSTDSKTLKSISSDGLTLVGYGIYSELLLSLVEKFLRIKWRLNNKKINHCLIRDSENLELIHQVEILKHYIIVVPIASTFSTSIKIQQEIDRLFENRIVITPHYNILFISDGYPSNILTQIEIEFGWEEKKPLDKIVTINPYNDGSSLPINQRYFLALKSEWHKIETCSKCFPENEKRDILEELPLFETDKTAVTPTLIFNLPIGRKISQEEGNTPFKLHAEMIRYGHHERNNSHFLFSVQTEDFLLKNQKAVEDWLATVKLSLRDTNMISESDHVMIVSTCHYSNAAFINLVNEQLFFSAATIIHYDPANDYIQNFVMVYGVEIARADKIIFVDDSLKSGSSFFKISEFIEHAQSVFDVDIEKRGITTCILLLNKAQDFTVSALQRRLKTDNAIYAFANLHLQTSLSSDQLSPLIIEQQRYEALTNDSFLDSLKTHFVRQSQKLDMRDRKVVSVLKQERHLRMLEATHLIYQYFALSSRDIAGLESFTKFKNQLYSKEIWPTEFAVYTLNGDGLPLPENDAALLKVLTQSPFVQYEPLKQIVFKWILKLLNETINVYSERIKLGVFTYEQFEHFKFLTRRAGLLNSNLIISDKMFDFLELIFSLNGIPKLKIGLIQDRKEIQLTRSGEGGIFEEQARNDLNDVNAKLKNLQDFIIFYVSQVKELLLQNETRGINLEYKLLKLRGKSMSPGFSQMIRVLTIENSLLLKRFYEFIKKQSGWPSLFKPENKDDFEISQSLITIAEHLEQHQIIGSFRFQNILHYLNANQYPNFGATPHRPSDDPLLLNYLWLEYFFQFDHHKGKMPSVDRADLVMKKMKLFFNDETAGCSKVGAFLLVRHTSEIFMVYNKNHKNIEELDEQNWDNPGNGYLKQFLFGEADESASYHKTVVELIKPNKDTPWQDSYGISGPVDIKNLQLNFLPDNINRLILIRTNKLDKKGKETGQGLLAFYFESSANKPTSSSVIKYLLLLRPSFISFIESHYENVEYRDWLISERTKKFVLLSGHGKEMLKSLAADGEMGDTYFRIANNLEQLQQMILSNTLSKSKPGKNIVLDKFNQFYHADGNLSINSKFLESLKNLANDIYKSPIVENSVDVKIDFPIPTDWTFAFSQNILELICFELFVNAKKNRWHELPSDRPKFKNTLKVYFSCVEEDGARYLNLRVLNSGPLVASKHVSRLGDKYNNIKTADPVSGTSLIKTLIYSYLDGKIVFKNLARQAGRNLGEFEVSITFKEMEKNG